SSTSRVPRSAEHRDEAVQRLGGGFPVLHHGDADIVRARIASVRLLAGQIAAGHHAHPGVAPQGKCRRLAAALGGNVKPKKKSAGGPAIAVTVDDDLIGELESLPIKTA